MRNIILAIALLTITESASLANQTLPTYGMDSYLGIIDKVAVRPEDLPEAVKSALASSYSEWKISSAYLVTKEDNTQYYEVNIKKTEESLTVNLDKYGKKLD